MPPPLLNDMNPTLAVAAKQHYDFNAKAIASNMARWPGTVTIGSKRLSVALKPDRIRVEMPGVGVVEHHAAIIWAWKKDFTAEPAVGTVITDTADNRQYIIGSISGRANTDPAWRLECIEKERTP